MIKTGLSLLLILSFQQAFSQKFAKTEDVIPFYALVGYGITMPVNNSTAWQINYDLNLAFPFEYSEKFFDLYAGLYIFDQESGAFNRKDYGTAIHLGVGKRFSNRIFLTGFYTGPAVMFIDKNYHQKTEVGWNFNAPLMYKPMEELGIGLNLFSIASFHEFVAGYAFCITLINIPKD